MEHFNKNYLSKMDGYFDNAHGCCNVPPPVRSTKLVPASAEALEHSVLQGRQVSKPNGFGNLKQAALTHFCDSDFNLVSWHMKTSF